MLTRGSQYGEKRSKNFTKLTFDLIHFLCVRFDIQLLRFVECLFCWRLNKRISDLNSLFFLNAHHSLNINSNKKKKRKNLVCM